MFDFKKEKEYYIEVSPKLFIKHVCKKIKKNTKVEIIFIVFYFPWNSVTKIYSVEEMNNFISVIEPVDNTEFFSMYINWLNFYRPGSHQDLTFAKEIGIKIINTLKIRTWVAWGSGAFTQFDRDKKNHLLKIYKNN